MTTTTPFPRVAKSVPPLQTGDRLSGEEFDRRYAAMPEDTRAELVEGVVYVPPPLFEEHHGTPHGLLVTCLGNYSVATPGVTFSDNASLRLDPRNRPQPDAYLRILDSHGGRTRRAPDGYVEGTPELIVEVAASSVSRDLHDKLAAYRRNGVREYVVWRTYDFAIDWFLLGGKRDTRLSPGKSGVYKSKAFPGLWVDAPALLRGDWVAVLRIVQEGIASPEHAAFVAKLKKAAARRKTRE
jgi:Uma2 family endonuclease